MSDEEQLKRLEEIQRTAERGIRAARVIIILGTVLLVWAMTRLLLSDWR